MWVYSSFLSLHWTPDHIFKCKIYFMCTEGMLTDLSVNMAGRIYELYCKQPLGGHLDIQATILLLFYSNYFFFKMISRPHGSHKWSSILQSTGLNWKTRNVWVWDSLVHGSGHAEEHYGKSVHDHITAATSDRPPQCSLSVCSSLLWPLAKPPLSMWSWHFPTAQHHAPLFNVN